MDIKKGGFYKVKIGTIKYEKCKIKTEVSLAIEEDITLWQLAKA
jgi:hypothetical protein